MKCLDLDIGEKVFNNTEITTKGKMGIKEENFQILNKIAIKHKSGVPPRNYLSYIDPHP